MTTYFVTRHAGAVEWAGKRGIAAESVTHLDVGRVTKGDKVIGTLPVSLAAEVCARGARYLHLTLDIPPEERGKELTAEAMHHLGARLEEYRVERVEKDA